MLIKPVQYWKNSWVRAVGYLLTLPLMFLTAFTITIRCTALAFRKNFYRSRHPVIAIGSVLAGGTGKTPLTQFLAEEYYCCGFRPAVISTGYRKSSKRTTLVSDGRQILTDVRDAGDEAMMLAKYFLNQSMNIPVVSGLNRVEAIKMIESHFDCNRILLDDALQYPALRPDVSIATIDAERLGRALLWIPWGYRRDRLHRLKSVNWVIITKNKSKENSKIATPYFHHLKNATILDSYYIPAYFLLWHNGQRFAQDSLKGKKIFAFSGLAYNDSFRTMLEATLNSLDATLIGFREFVDHYWYTPDDLQKLFHRRPDAMWWITTEKDAVKIQSDWVPLPLRDRLLILVCRTMMNHPRKWIHQIEQQLSNNNLTGKSNE